MSLKRISVCMPTYNGASYIKDQLQSILLQIGEEDEIIISDDHSTDGTVQLINEFNDSRIKVLSHESCCTNLTLTDRKIFLVYKNLENALLHAKGDYIFLSDQDDVWIDGKVDKLLYELEHGCDLVLHNASLTNARGEIVHSSYFDFCKPSHNIFRILFKPYYQGASMAFNRKILLLSLPFPSIFSISHDHWIGYVARTHGNKIKIVDTPLILYRRHESNVSSNIDRNDNRFQFKVMYRVRTIISYILASLR